MKSTNIWSETWGVSRIKDRVYSKEERIARALELIDKEGFITLYDYANINHFSRSVASKELKKITADNFSPIASRCQHRHKVWVRSNKE